MVSPHLLFAFCICSLLTTSLAVVDERQSARSVVIQELEHALAQLDPSLTLKTIAGLDAENREQTSCASSSVPSNPASPVWPSIGTGGVGYGIAAINPAASVPFGMARVGPDTSLIFGLRLPWRQFSGYHSCDTEVRAFSHTHLVGAGTIDYGNVGLMPVVDLTDKSVLCKNALPSKKTYMRVCNYRTAMDKSQERMSPAYYSVALVPASKQQITVELTATAHVGVHRYTWSPAASYTPSIIIDVCHSIAMNFKKTANATVTIDTQSQEIFGQLHSQGDYSQRYGGFMLYYVVRFNETFASAGGWTNNALLPNNLTLSGDDNIGAYVSFRSQSGKSFAVETQVAISFVSVAQARVNLDLELGSSTASKSFSDVYHDASTAWQSALNVAKVTGGTPEDQTKFHTALFHTFLAPTKFSEHGVYKGFDGAIHDAKGFNFYTDLSIWDIFRTEFPLLILLQPKLAQDVMSSMLLMAQQQGRLPKWPMANGDTDGMNGLHSIPMLVDGVLAGLSGHGTSPATNLTDILARSAHDVRMEEGSAYAQLGYIPNTPSDTLEFTLDDFCVSVLADRLNDSATHSEFLASSQNYKNLWNDDVKFYCPKNANGSWVECNSPWWPVKALYPWDQYYREGDAWHYRFYPLQNYSALVDQFGSKAQLAKELDTFFTNSFFQDTNFFPNPYYWAGNEEDLHSAYVFGAADRPDLTQQYTRKLLQTRYTTRTDGISGNDDYGTMSAWFVWNAMGLFPMPCQGKLALGSPLFDSITISRALLDGQTGTIAITAHDNSAENVFVERVAINGQLQGPGPWFIDTDILQAQQHVSIDFYMSNKP